MAIFECDNGAAYSGIVEIGPTTGKVYMGNGPMTTTVNTTNSMPLNDWARIEVRMKFSLTTGNADLKLFLDPDDDTPTETISFSGVNSGTANATNYYTGSPFSVPNKPTTYFSGLELNDVGWPGPAPFRPGKGVPGILCNPVAIHTAMF